MSAGLVLGGPIAAKPPQIPVYAAATRTLWLDQGWSSGDRDWFHHVSQGTDTLPIPYSWFLALERPNVSLRSPGLFSDPAFLDRFGFIPSPATASNPGALSVGFARTRAVDPTNGKPFDQLGFTCAACHTGRFDYRGTAVYIDGGPAMTDIGKFRGALGFALGLTLVSPPRFLRFAQRVLGPGYSAAALAQLKLALAATVKEGFKLQLAGPHPKGDVEEGFGRLDALNRIGNEVFAAQLGDNRNHVALSAPVAYPHIWDAPWFDWVQYNSSIEQPMVRNAGEAMGVRALVNYDGVALPRFTSTISMQTLHEIETMLAGKQAPTAHARFNGLRSPAWPEDVLSRIDRTLAARGAGLYEQHCSRCHLPAVQTPAFWSSPAWSPANAAGERYLRLAVVPVTAIGTDPAQAVDMKNRVVRAPLSFGFSGAVGKDGAVGLYPFGPALGQIVEKVVIRWYDAQTPPTPAADRDRMNGYRPNGIRDGIASPNGTVPAYKARPLDGIWATAPYLHNGSVPTLYDLLSPYAERPRDFWLGNREFDPVKVGYVTGPLAGGFRMVAADARTGAPIRGNGNGGHLFETPVDPAHPRPGTIGPMLSPADRRALVEYLKTL
ncbi:di-heme-cytochrome C peroxidase [Sphingomonas sp. BIUV-7]|uniref:Di-heme-cytochrome C peroxidase n=1 Tax=Sphingomonas natans TaxID=3063330 RepID=A0ABT8YCH6_9SPHN|nr:di-heme-cytochrome C peroxidase [Sphingomonas sp. BIUV-7]MDO6416043.1 di-heme-cytochrome C peroxidase [Sphingomonas sp. BIUV-7]